MANYYLVHKESNRIVDRVATEDAQFEVHEDFTWVEGPDMQEGETTAEYNYTSNGGVVKKEATQLSYEIERRFNYPSYADQFDLLYHGGYDAWKAEITKIKDQYPKPAE